MESTETYAQSARLPSTHTTSTADGRAYSFDIGPRQLKAIEALYVALHPGEEINWPDLGGPREWVKRNWERIEPVAVAAIRGDYQGIHWTYAALVGRLNPSKRVCDALYTRLQDVYETARARDIQFTWNDHIAFTEMIPVLALARDVRATAIVHRLIQLDECPTYAMSEYLRSLFRIGVVESLGALQTMPLRKTHEGIERLAAFVEKTIERKVPHAPAPPSLQRMKVLNAHSYAFDFAAAHGPAAPALVQISNMRGTGEDDRTTYYYLLGNMPANTHLEPLRWDANGGMIVCTYPHVVPGTGPFLNRYPIHALVSRSNMVSALDRSRLDHRSVGPYGRPAPNYGGLAPIGAAHLGLEGWELGDEPMGNGLHMCGKCIPVTHYDIRALDDSQVELFVTMNDKLSRWLFDGKKWTFRRNYPGTINGPFLICDEGNALVAEVDGHWCLVRGFDKQNAEVRQIVKKTDNEPLVLVEDLVARTNYFQLGGRLYDENGAGLWTVRRGQHSSTQFKSIVDYVCSRRPN